MVFYILICTLFISVIVGIFLNIKYYFGNDVGSFCWCWGILTLGILVIFSLISARETFVTETKEFNSFNEIGIGCVLKESTQHELDILYDGTHYRMSMLNLTIKRIEKINHIIVEYNIGSYKYIKGDKDSEFLLPSFMLVEKEKKIHMSSINILIPSNQTFNIEVLPE